MHTYMYIFSFLLYISVCFFFILDISLARHTLGEVAVSVEELPRFCRLQLLPVQPIWH